MEGVVVTARRDGANVDVSVVSDAQGTFNFPRTHLEPASRWTHELRFTPCVVHSRPLGRAGREVRVRWRKHGAGTNNGRGRWD